MISTSRFSQSNLS